MEDIYALAQTYTSSAEGDVKVAYSTSRGYFLQISSYESELPGIFIQAVQNRRTISCTTLELASLSDRACEAIGTALRITNELIQVFFKKHCNIQSNESMKLGPYGSYSKS